MRVENILTLLALLGGVIAAAWVVFAALVNKLDAMTKDNDQKIKRVYERQDEEIEKIQKEYLRIDVHNLSVEYLKEIQEVKSNATIQLFTTRLDNLAYNVKELIDRINHKENNS